MKMSKLFGKYEKAKTFKEPVFMLLLKTINKEKYDERVKEDNYLLFKLGKKKIPRADLLMFIKTFHDFLGMRSTNEEFLQSIMLKHDLNLRTRYILGQCIVKMQEGNSMYDALFMYKKNLGETEITTLYKLSEQEDIRSELNILLEDMVVKSKNDASMKSIKNKMSMSFGMVVVSYFLVFSYVVPLLLEPLSPELFPPNIKAIADVSAMVLTPWKLAMHFIIPLSIYILLKTRSKWILDYILLQIPILKETIILTNSYNFMKAYLSGLRSKSVQDKSDFSLLMSATEVLDNEFMKVFFLERIKFKTENNLELSYFFIDNTFFASEVNFLFKKETSSSYIDLISEIIEIYKDLLIKFNTGLPDKMGSIDLILMLANLAVSAYPTMMIELYYTSGQVF